MTPGCHHGHLVSPKPARSWAKANRLPIISLEKMDLEICKELQLGVCNHGANMCVLSRFSHVQLCNPLDSSSPGSSVHGILQAKILEWVGKPSSRGSSWPISYVSSLAGRFFMIATWEAVMVSHKQIPYKNGGENSFIEEKRKFRWKWSKESPAYHWLRDSLSSAESLPWKKRGLSPSCWSLLSA